MRAGVDVDESCRWPYERNVGSTFVRQDIARMEPDEVEALFGRGDARLLAGCAPCQPFSTYGRTRRRADDRWRLLRTFASLVEAVRPEFVTMENVPGLAAHDVFARFIGTLRRCGYDVSYGVLDCERYGVPQRRRRLVLIASRLGPAALPQPLPNPPLTVRETIGHLPPIEAGGPPPADDPLHIAAGLSPKNLERIKHSKPGGTWRDWPAHLRAECHRKRSGRTYPSIYGRMRWDEPAPTITTQCYGYGNGRFGHPEQNRAISLREAALLQSFPAWWQFVPPNRKAEFTPVGRAIGNAVPPKLAEAIGRVVVRLAEEKISPAAAVPA